MPFDYYVNFLIMLQIYIIMYLFYIFNLYFIGDFNFLLIYFSCGTLLLMASLGYAVFTLPC